MLGPGAQQALVARREAAPRGTDERHGDRETIGAVLTSQLAYSSDIIEPSMGHRAFTPVDRIPLVGGLPCLDFVNTTGGRASSAPRERLQSYRDLLVFGERSGLLPERAASRTKGSKRRPAEARTFARMLALRETVYRLLLCALEHRAPTAADLRAFNRELREASRHRKLEWSSTSPVWTRASTDDVEAMRWALVESAADLLDSPSELALLKKCGECDWLFLDTSKNKGRRWCKKSCGDRVKARSYYRRKRGRAKGRRSSGA